MLFNQDPIQLLYALPALIIALTVHELAHAAAALARGDRTAKDDGRLSLNPLRHLDPLGFLFLLVAGFGWAKPVAFDPRNLKNPRIDPMLVALAGPASNLLMAALCLPLFHLVIGGWEAAYAAGGFPAQAMEIAFNLLKVFFTLNLGLFIFNLIPLPPLDGSYVLFGALPNLSLERKVQIYRIGTLALFGLLLASAATGYDLLPIGAMVNKLAGILLAAAGLG